MFPGASRSDVEKVLNDAEKVGDIVHLFSSENDLRWMEGAGISLGDFGCARGDGSFIVAGVFGCERYGVALGEGERIRYGRMNKHVREVL